MDLIRKLQKIKFYQDGVSKVQARVCIPLHIVDAMGWHNKQPLKISIIGKGKLKIEEVKKK